MRMSPGEEGAAGAGGRLLKEEAVEGGEHPQAEAEVAGEGLRCQEVEGEGVRPCCPGAEEVGAAQLHQEGAAVTTRYRVAEGVEVSQRRETAVGATRGRVVEEEAQQESAAGRAQALERVPKGPAPEWTPARVREQELVPALGRCARALAEHVLASGCVSAPRKES